MMIYDVEGGKLIERIAEDFKKLEQMKMPEWAKFVKTSVARERTPAKSDWWYVRAASILRKICMKGPIGVNKLKKDYGGRSRRGHRRNSKSRSL